MGELQHIGGCAGGAAMCSALHHVGVGDAFPEKCKRAGAGLIMGGGAGRALCTVAIFGAGVGGDLDVATDIGGGVFLIALGRVVLTTMWVGEARNTRPTWLRRKLCLVHALVQVWVGFFRVLLRPTDPESRCHL